MEHYRAILNTMQQVAGAAGVALLVALMAGRAATLGAAGVPAVAAQVGGLHLAFTGAGLIALIAVALAFFLRAAPQPALLEVREPAGQPGD